MPSVNTAKIKALEKGLLAADRGKKGGYEYMFAIRLPETASAKGKGKPKERKKWKEYLEKLKETKNGMTVQKVLESLVVSKQRKVHFGQDGETSKIISCDETLEGTLNCAVGMILSFFESLKKSHESHSTPNCPVDIELLMFASIEVNKIFICTRMSPKLAETLADMAEYAVQLSPEGLVELGIRIIDQKDLIPAWVKYDEIQKTKGLLRIIPRPDKPNQQTIVSHIDRIRLLYDKITDHLGIWELQQMFQPMDITMKMFPIHDEQEIVKLQQSWATWRLFFQLDQPLDDIRNYYGEEIAFYFHFTMVMRKGLLVLLALSLLFWGRWTEFALPYTVVMVAWFAGLQKYWKRTEAYHANRWGSDYTHTNAAVKDLANPGFTGKVRPSELDANKDVSTADPREQNLAIGVSVFVGTVFIGLVTGGVILNRTAVAWSWITRPVGNLLVSVQIKVFGMTWGQVAPRLSAREHHVSMGQLAQSNALKSFVFTFFNAFNAFFWVAYVSPRMDREVCITTPGGCRAILQSSLVQAFPFLVFLAGFGMLAPWYNIWMKYRKQKNDLKEKKKKDLASATEVLPSPRKRSSAGEAIAESKNVKRLTTMVSAISYKGDEPDYKISSMEMQTKMLDYGEEDVADDFMQVIASIAFVAMWAVVAPITTVSMAYIALSVQNGVDAIRVTKLYQRPFPNRVATIGIWNGIMVFLKYASIFNLTGLLVTNPRVDIAGDLGILPYECNEFEYQEHNHTQRLELYESHPECSMTFWANCLVFVVVLIVLLVGVAVFDALVPDVGYVVAREKRRQVYQRAKLFDFAAELEFQERVVLEGHSRWEESEYHLTQQMTPDNPDYVRPVGSAS